MTLLLTKDHRGAEKTHSVEKAQREAQRGAQRGGAAKLPKSFHPPDIPLQRSQLITGNPYNTQPSSYPYHIQAYNQQYPVNRTAGNGRADMF